jgi:hypothetical protein
MVTNQTRNSSGEDASLSRPGARNYEKRTFEVENGLALSRVEPRKWLCITGRGGSPGGIQRFIHQLKIISKVAPRSEGTRTSSPP